MLLLYSCLTIASFIFCSKTVLLVLFWRVHSFGVTKLQPDAGPMKAYGFTPVVIPMFSDFATVIEGGAAKKIRNK